YGLLTERKGHRVFIGKATPCQAAMQFRNKSGEALFGIATAEIDETGFGVLATGYADAEKGPYKRRVLGTDLLQFSYIERAAGDIRQRLHRDTDGRINNKLRPCNISGHENGQNLPPPVRDMNEAGRP